MNSESSDTYLYYSPKGVKSKYSYKETLTSPSWATKLVLIMAIVVLHHKIINSYARFEEVPIPISFK